MTDDSLNPQAQRQARGRRLLLLLICVALATGTPGSAPPAAASFSGRNGRIAYVQASTTSDRTNIFTVRRDGTGKRRLTRTGDALSPDWSPNGRRIVFVRNGPAIGVQIWVMGARGGHKRLLLARRSPRDPAWSPDGHHIVFDRQVGRTNSQQLFVLSLRSRTVRRLTHGARHGWDAFDPAWSPDGRRIVFTRSDSTSAGQLFTVRPDGTRLRRLTRGPRMKSSPEWSPDGTRIAYTRSVLLQGCSPDVFVVNRSGGRPHKVLDRGCRDEDPSWAPNGNRIVASSVVDPTVDPNFRHHSGLLTFRPDGSHPRLVLRGVSKFEPDWQVRR